MKVRPIVETCRIRKLMKLGCYGCEYKGSDCKQFKELLGVRCPGEASRLGPELTKEIKNHGCKR